MVGKFRKERGKWRDNFSTKATYDTTLNVVRVHNEELLTFETRDGLKQGCILRPLLLSVVTDKAIKSVKSKVKPIMLGYWKMKKVSIS